MEERSWLARYAAFALIFAGGVEWFLGRTVSRMAAAPVIQGTARSVIEALGRIGLFMVSPTFILAALIFFLGLFNYLSEGGPARRWRTALVSYLLVFGAALLALLFLSSTTWLVITFNLLSFAAVWLLALNYTANASATWWERSGVLLVALAYTGWYYYVVQQNGINAGLSLPGGPTLVLNLGEIFAVTAPFAFFFAYVVPGGEWKPCRRWIVPVLLALAFSAGNLADLRADMGFTGVFTIYSLGFNLFLPWPIYAIALALYIYTILTLAGSSEGARDPNRALGLLLLLFAGYALQEGYQHLLAILSLMLLTGVARPFSPFTKDSSAAASAAQITGSSHEQPVSTIVC
ncbi:MAG: hypothetical protein M3014_12340 [Chloroflexota bacterium]|nr:hypothetical protein [Chloroflexota bacterium]